MQPGMDAERAAWIRETLDQFEGPLIRYAARLTGNLDAARDVVQDAFLRLCSEDPESLRDRIAPWLYTVCRNRVFDAFRKEKRMHPLEDRAVEAFISPLPSPSETLDQSETETRLLAALDRLPQRQQEVIRLKFQEDFSYREISEITGHSVNYVGVLIHTGMKTLREGLADLSAGA